MDFCYLHDINKPYRPTSFVGSFFVFRLWRKNSAIIFFCFLCSIDCTTLVMQGHLLNTYFSSNRTQDR